MENKENKENTKNKKPWYEKVSIWITMIAGICTIIIALPQIIKFIPLTQKQIDVKVESLKEEIELLDIQLHQISSRDEYILKNGEGHKIDVSDVLDYHMVISKLEELSQYYYFLDLMKYMDIEGYNVDGEKMDTIMKLFFRLNYEDQADILSNAFPFCEYYTYKVATEYSYTADVTEYEDHTEYSNIKATATKIEERGIPIFICTQLSDTPFGLIRISEQNIEMVYTK